MTTGTGAGDAEERSSAGGGDHWQPLRMGIAGASCGKYFQGSWHPSHLPVLPSPLLTSRRLGGTLRCQVSQLGVSPKGSELKGTRTCVGQAGPRGHGPC